MNPFPQLRAAIRRDHRISEAAAVERLRALQPDAAASGRIHAMALRLATQVRNAPPAALSAESFLRHYGLTTPEGVALMCVAEALPRIPDAETADALLREKLGAGNLEQGDPASWVASAAD